MSKNKKTIGSFNEKETLQKLRELVQLEISKEDGLKCPTSDEFLIRFLRGKKGDPEAAMKGIHGYYQLRESIPDFLPMLHPSALTKHFEAEIFTVLKNKDSQGRSIILFRSRNWNPYEFKVNEMVTVSYLLAEELISYDETQRNGIIVVTDHGNLTYTNMMKIASQISLKNIRQLVACYQGAVPARFKAMHVINHPYVFDLLFKLAKPFMRDKLKKRIFEHGHNLESLHEHVSPEFLPQSLGGKILDSEITDKEFMEKLFAKDEYYKEMATYGYKSTPKK